MKKKMTTCGEDKKGAGLEQHQLRTKNRHNNSSSKSGEGRGGSGAQHWSSSLKYQCGCAVLTLCLLLASIFRGGYFGRQRQNNYAKGKDVEEIFCFAPPPLIEFQTAGSRVVTSKQAGSFGLYLATRLKMKYGIRSDRFNLI